MSVVVLAALAGCSGAACTEGSTRSARAPGTVRMAERLESIAADSQAQGHPYRSAGRLDSALALDLPADPKERITFEATLALESLHAGRTEEAIGRFEQVIREIEAARVPIAPELELAVLKHLGLAHLEVWERANCLEPRDSRPCAFPVENRGEPRARESALSAVRIFSSLLDAGARNLEYLWLANLAGMMAGEDWGGLPERWRIPRREFRSEHDLGRFVDIAPELGVDVNGHAGGAIMDDFDGDGHLDIVASSWHLSDQLRFFRNDGAGGFSDRTSEAGLDGITGGLHLVQADYDNDGDLDVLVLRGAWATYGEPNSLLRNRGDGSFEDVTEEAGLLDAHSTQTAAWGDFDNDGWLDLYVGNEATHGRQVSNQLFHSNRDGTFTDVASETGTDVSGFVKAVLWGDVDNDGRADLFISRLRQSNVLLRNEGPDPDGSWRFSDVTAIAGVSEPLESFPAWFWDFDNDGWLDLFVSGYRAAAAEVAAEYLGISHEAEWPRLFWNRGNGTFAEVAETTGLRGRVLLTMGSNYGDLDNDGYPDFYAGTGDALIRTVIPNRMFRNAGGRLFQDVTTSGGFGLLGKGHGVAFGDFDGDGDQDVYATMGGAYEGDISRNVLFENPGHANRWITLRLEGVRSNRSAIGARIKITVQTAGVQREIHTRVSSGGSFGANSLQQEIGLGPASAIESIEITWPATGLTETYPGVEMDRVYRVREDGSSLVLVGGAVKP